MHSETRHFTLYNTNNNCIIQTLKMRAAGIHRFLKDERTTEEKLFATSKHVATSKSVINTNTKTKTEMKLKNSSTEIISEIQKATIITDEEEQIINFELKTVNAPLLHQNTNQWIIFSDLHVKRYVRAFLFFSSFFLLFFFFFIFFFPSLISDFINSFFFLLSLS